MNEIPKKRSRGRPKSLFKEPQGATVQALDRGLILLRDIATRGSGTLAEISSRNDLPASTAHRILATLAQHGLVDMSGNEQQWHIGIEAFRIGGAYLTRTNVVEMARPVMRQLMEKTGETANLGIADNGEVVFVGQVETHNPIRAFFRPGSRGPMHSSGIGKALLSAYNDRAINSFIHHYGLAQFTPKTLTTANALIADLDQARQNGWAFDDDERYLGMRCVAAPIFNSFGEAVAGISISGPSVRFPDAAIATIGPLVRDAAEQVTQSIGGKKLPL